MAGVDDFAKIVGKAVLDQDFSNALHEDPDLVARSVGVQLNNDQVAALKDLSPDHLATVANALRDKVLPAAFVDQQQQQALMD